MITINTIIIYGSGVLFSLIVSAFFVAKIDDEDINTLLLWFGIVFSAILSWLMGIICITLYCCYKFVKWLFELFKRAKD